MYQNYLLLEKLAQERQRELRKEADAHRLLKAAGLHRPRARKEQLLVVVLCALPVILLFAPALLN